jgi:hypothetical protein
MRAKAKTFVADIPGQMPRGCLLTPNFQAVATGSMKFGVRIGGINEHVRIDNKHLASPFHNLVQGVAIGDIDQMASASKSGKGSKFWLRLAAAGLKKQPQRRFDQLGHGLTLSSCFPPETAHDGIVNVKRSLHMENHIHDMAICQPSIAGGVVGQAFARRPQPAGETPAAPQARCLCRQPCEVWLSILYLKGALSARE